MNNPYKNLAVFAYVAVAGLVIQGLLHLSSIFTGLAQILVPDLSFEGIEGDAISVWFMMQESRVTRPSRSGHAARPTQQLGSFSDARPAASTASSDRPFFCKTGQAALFAVIPLSQVDTTTGVFIRNVNVGAALCPAVLSPKAKEAPATERPIKSRLFICLEQCLVCVRTFTTWKLYFLARKP